jgi:hypothetical protein
VPWPDGAPGEWPEWDLSLLFDERIADRFPDSYQAARGQALPDPLLCDLWAVARSHDDVETWDVNYRDLRRADLTAAWLRARHAAWTRRLLDAA